MSREQISWARERPGGGAAIVVSIVFLSLTGA